MTNCISKHKPDKGKVFIYTLSNPITNEIRYIGKTKQSLYVRYCEHISFKNHRNNLKYYSKNWIKSLLNKHLKPKIELLDIVDQDNWEKDEIFYIEYFKYLGFNLTNHQLGGGSGNTGLKWNIDKEKLKNKRDLIKKSRLNPYNLFNLKGNIVKTYNNLMEASDDLNINYNKLYNYSKNKGLINQEFILLKNNVIFNELILKRTYRKIKITNHSEEKIFNSQKECSEYLKIHLSMLNKIIHNKIVNNTPYKFELV